MRKNLYLLGMDVSGERETIVRYRMMYVVGRDVHRTRLSLESLSLAEFEELISDFKSSGVRTNSPELMVNHPLCLRPLPHFITFLTKLLGPSLADEVLDDLERNYDRDINERQWPRWMAISCAVTKALEAVAGYWFNLDRLKKIADIVGTIRKPAAK